MGWLMRLMMSHSLRMWSVCFDSMISAFFMVLTQNMVESFLRVTRRTFPNEPDPSSVVIV